MMIYFKRIVIPKAQMAQKIHLNIIFLLFISIIIKIECIKIELIKIIYINYIYKNG